MHPALQEGWIAVCDCDAEPANGNIVVAKRNETATIKRFRRTGYTVLLTSDNQTHGQDYQIHARELIWMLKLVRFVGSLWETVHNMKRQQMQVTLSHPPYNYRRHMFFNRYCMEPCDSFTIFHFGLVDTAGHILDSYACLMHETSIAANMKTLEDFYVAQCKTKLKGKYTHEWMPPTRPEKVDFSMIMAMAVFSDNTIGEIVFASHAMQPALTSVRRKFAEARKRSPKANSPALQHVIEGDALAALKCDWFVLKSFLEQLMESTNASKS